MGLLDPPATPLAALESRFASTRAPRNTAVCMGDSNTANPRGVDISDSDGTSQTTAWFTLLCALSNGSIRHGGTFARASYDTAQVRDSKLAAILALNPAPGACFINLGTNDITKSSGTGFDIGVATAAYVDIIRKLRGNGILPIICIPVPNNGFPLVMANQQAWNKRLRELAEVHRCPLVNFYDPVLDLNTGGIATVAQQDGTHVNSYGRRALATAALEQGIAAVFPPAPPLTSKSAADPSNLVPSGQGLFLGGASSGWSNAGDTANLTVTHPAPAEQDNLAGYWMQLVHTGGLVTRQMSPTTPATPWATGDTLEFTARVQTSGIDAALLAALAPGIQIRVELRDASTSYGYIGLLGTTSYDTDLADATIRCRGTAPANADRFRVQLSIQGASTTYPIQLRVGEVTVRNLTALGTYVPA